MPTEAKKQNILHGAMVLGAAAIIVKIIGAVFRIPLGNLIGGQGLGYFSTAYNLFNTIYSLVTAGLPIAVSKMVAESMAKGRYRDVRRIARVSANLFIVLGVIGTILMFFLAGPFANAAGNPNAYWALVSMAPTILFGCLMAIFRGYYQGQRNMYPTAISQIIEAIGKLVFGILFAIILLNLGVNSYANPGDMVYGVQVYSQQEALEASYPFAAAGAILGITLSTAVAAVYLMIKHRRSGDGISRQDLVSAPRATERNILFKRLLWIAIPISIGAVINNLTNTIDLFTVMNRLETTLVTDEAAIRGVYGDLLSSASTTDLIPNFLYGCYQIAINLYNLIPAITISLGISALPSISATWSVGDRASTKKNMESVLRITMLIAVPTGLGMMVLSGPILMLLYGGSSYAEAAIATPLLSILGLAVILVAMSTPIASMLQAVGRTDVPVKVMLVGGVVKLGINYVLIGIPGINIQGAAIGTVVCYIIILLSELVILCKYTSIVPNITGVFIKPLFAGSICALAAYGAQSLIGMLTDSRLSVIFSIGVAAIVYIIALLVTKSLTRDDLEMIPKGEKLIKVLEKRGLIG